MAKSEGISYTSIVSKISKKQYAPIYLLMGEEGYFIDSISSMIESNTLSKDEKSFNFSVMYGIETEVADVIFSCKQFPMMSEYRLVILKEAQDCTKKSKSNKLDDLIYYAQSPQPSTILIVEYKKEPFKNKKLFDAITKAGGIVAEFNKLRDSELPGYIDNYIKRKGYTADEKCISLLADSIGSDLSRLFGEIDKLLIACDSSKRINLQLIEENIGISREYNNLELINAIVNKDVSKANKIIANFSSNPKKNPTQVTVAFLFNYFSNLLIAFFAKDKSPNGIAGELGLRWSGAANDYLKGMRNYNAFKVIEIISALRKFDGQSKGIGSYQNDQQLLKELIFFILH